MTKERIALKGHVYATPKTESVEIKNQGVLCASGNPSYGMTLNVSNGGLN